MTEHRLGEPANGAGRSRALVLGGGGVAGIAWMLGVIDGLRHHGLDLAAAHLIVGTSAGSCVGAAVAARRARAGRRAPATAGYQTEELT